MLPHPTQNLCALRSMLEQAFDADGDGCLLASSECIVVLVVDGVSLECAEACWTPSVSQVLTSTFPSTSSTALLSATTGLMPADHGVIGVAFYDPVIDGVFDCYRDVATVARNGGDIEFAGDGVRLGPWPTVFSTLSDRVDCVAHIGALATLPGRWSRMVVHGARVVSPSVDWNEIRNDPKAMVDAVTTEIEATLSGRRSRPCLLWAHVNIDSAIHIRGYDFAVRDALSALADAAQRWASNGHTVITHSDHGLVETHDSGRARALLALLQNPTYCRVSSGGAGRVIWAYPRDGLADELLERAREQAYGFAVAKSRDELLRSGAVGASQLARERIGEVVVIPTGSEFPLFESSYHFEHGAFSEAEMITPLAICKGR
jgi:hypothetical protein